MGVSGKKEIELVKMWCLRRPPSPPADFATAELPMPFFPHLRQII